MEDFNSETDSDYASYWRDWVGPSLLGTLYVSALRLSTRTLLLFPFHDHLSLFDGRVTLCS